MATDTSAPSPIEVESGGSDQYLNPSNPTSNMSSRMRIASEEQDDDDVGLSGSFGDNSTLFNSSLSDLRNTAFTSKREMVLNYLGIAIEGDLAGFQIAWVAMSTGFFILKIFNITDVIQTIEWWSIFVIPFFNAILTAWFDYIIRKYRSTNTVESLRKARFVVLWLVKVVVSIYITTYWIWGSGSFMERFEQREDYQVNRQACTGQIVVIYTSVLAAVFMSEVMITTVLINSEQNLSVRRTPMSYRFILLIIRPFVWVYNRTMVMFLCFYSIYGLMYTLFVVGFLCDMYCDSFYSKENQKLGLRMLLVPFTHPSYLLNIDQIFRSWDETPDAEFLDTFVIVFLCQSFYVDCLNSLWQFSRRYLKPSKTVQLEASKSLRQVPTESDQAFMTELAAQLPTTPDSSVPPGHPAFQNAGDLSIERHLTSGSAIKKIVPQTAKDIETVALK
eukprot:194512_1